MIHKYTPSLSEDMPFFANDRTGPVVATSPDTETLITAVLNVVNKHTGFQVLHGGGAGAMAEVTRVANQHGIPTLGIGTQEIQGDFPDLYPATGAEFVLAPDMFSRYSLMLIDTPIAVILAEGGSW